MKLQCPDRILKIQVMAQSRARSRNVKTKRLDLLKKRRFLIGKSRRFVFTSQDLSRIFPFSDAVVPLMNIFRRLPVETFPSANVIKGEITKSNAAIFLELPLGCHSGAIRVLLANIDLGLDPVTRL
jgi:hypothetical protein